MLRLDTAAAPAALRPYIPAWLSESATTDLKNELLAAAPPGPRPGTAALIRDMRAQRSDLVAAWRTEGAPAGSPDGGAGDASSPELSYDDEDSVLFLT